MRQRNQWLPSSISLQEHYAQGELSLGKTKKKTAPQFEVLITGEFWGAHDSWTEYLCLARNADGSITLSSRAREILAEAYRYKERDWLPGTIGRKEVHGFDGDYVVGERLLLHNGGAEVTVAPNQFDVAARWLIDRQWDRNPQLGAAWARIRSALYGPEFFNLAKPLTAPGGTAPDRSPADVVGESGEVDGGTPSRLDGRQPREIVIRCAGPSKPCPLPAVPLEERCR